MMEIFFFILLFVVAFMYASVGHGGASGYLALMALMGFDPVFMRHSALILNVFVSLVAFFMFYKGGHFKWKLLWPFLVTSMPMAFVGAGLAIDPPIYKMILAVCLLLAIFRIVFVIKPIHSQVRDIPLWAALLTGGLIGLVSGFIGIGGGIILTPVLLLFGWATVKQAAAVSALFIFLNSLAGLVGVQHALIELDERLVMMVLVALTGGLAGSMLGSYRFNLVSLKYILATVLLLASVKLALL